jgi:ubiquinone/menaquinone biosynthesis C-methylase UbiE
MNLSTVQKRLFAWGMSKANSADMGQIKLKNYPEYENFSDLKQSLLGDLSGTVLEIGAGAGANFSYYPKTINWLGIEPNNFMFPYLKEEAIKHGLNSLEFHQGCAENLPISDHSIDTVVSTHVLCSVKDVNLSLQEIYRVLKPDGKFILLEHIGAELGTINRYFQTIIDPLWQKLFDNCHVQRNPEQLLKIVGFTNIKYRYFQLPVPIVNPHVVGIAYKSNIEI